MGKRLSKQEAIALFHSAKALAGALGISKAAVSQWPEAAIPENHDLKIRYELHKGVALTGPLGETSTDWIGIGFGESLDDALVSCLRGLISWLHAAAGVSEGEAYALCSMAVSFRVTQYADQTGSVYTSFPPKAIHAMIPKQILGERLLARIESSMRPKA